MWMPTANDEDVEFPIPMHPNLEVLSVSVQPFNNCMPPIILVFYNAKSVSRVPPTNNIPSSSGGRSVGCVIGSKQS